jgi:DNA-binding transcriptional LysR family regulator
MRSLNPRQVEAFRAVMLTGSMTAAGTYLGISQPAISRLVHDFEHQVQLALFVRQGAQVLPTPEAVLLYEEVRRSFTGLEQISRTATQIRGGRAGSLRIAAMPAFALGYLARIIAEFLADRPNISIKLHSDVSQNILNLVATDQFDVGIGATPMEHAGVRTQLLPELEAVCILPRHHALAARPEIAVADLEGASVIGLTPNSRLGQRIDLTLRNAGVAYRMQLQGTLGTTLCSLVAEDLGVAIVDPFTAISLRDERIVRRRFRPRLPYDCALVMPAYRPEGRLVGEFAVALREAMLADFASGE